ncbi:MAG: HAMP domain-containing histidine kinase [Proteobacteria bacterium]|nr:HAMP domain-containing histidine kinase [Pseudomonadota bacterium]MBU1686155.1 HAMP domain-containing histidine kinase [Pseudomonadota bacterium]
MNDTYFAPAARTERRKFYNQIGQISHSPIMSTLLTACTGLLVVLNKDRQIVALNHSFLEATGIDNPEEALGLRLGESLHCVHAHEQPNGCGTTPYCRTCGAAIAMMAAINDDVINEQPCALTAKKGDEIVNLCLLIRAQPIVVDNHRWILVYAQDITMQQFWMNLEQVFFHDVNNILTSLLGHAALMATDQPDNEDAQTIHRTAIRLCSEISLQKSLSLYKDTDYLVNNSGVTLQQIRQEVELIIKGHRATDKRRIVESGPAQNIKIHTDPLLVTRVLGNMLINALEATPKGDEIRLTTVVEPDWVVWEVWNPAWIDEDVQKRVFQRHFSTKSTNGRGLGTFSMKLFGEKYLGGQVSFCSTKPEGTTFTFRHPRR